MPSEAIPGARFVDPKILLRVGNLELLARHVVEGFINGLHRAPFFGASIDFAEHRGYVAGDDIRRVDWRLYARTDRYYVKRSKADTNTNLSVLLDISRSMKFASRGIPKLEYGCYVGACLAYLAQRQRDRVGMITFDNDIVTHIPPSAKHFNVVLHTLEQARAERPGNLAVPLNKMAEHFKRRGILVLISDFYEEPDAILEAIKPLEFLGNDLIVFHVLDPAEIDFGYDDASSFEDLESGEQIPVVPESLAEGISRDDPGAHRGADDEVFRAPDRLHLLNTAEPLDRALFSYLSSRERLMRVDDSEPSSRSRSAPVMAFLTPLFLAGLGAIAIPVLIHLIQRERKRVIEFPSLMFVRRIPYQSVRRRRIRHWALLLLRAAAIALIVAAFARPFSAQGAVAAAAGGGAREVVILLDQSASMGYGDHWSARAGRGARASSAAWARRSRDARAVRQERRGEHARDRRPNAARRRDQRGEGRIRRDALRPGAQACREHPEPIADSSGARRC